VEEEEEEEEEGWGVGGANPALTGNVD